MKIVGVWQPQGGISPEARHEAGALQRSSCLPRARFLAPEPDSAEEVGGEAEAPESLAGDSAGLA